VEEQIDDVDYNEMIDDLEEEIKPKKKKKHIPADSSDETRNSKVIDIEDKERLLLAQLLNNSEMFIKAIAYLDKDFFETKINKLIVEFMAEYYELYKSVPPADAILIELNLDDTRSDWLDIGQEWPSAYLEDFLNSFIKNMSMKGAIEDSIELLEVEDYGTIEKKIKDAVSVDIDTTLGVTVDSSKDSFRELFGMLTSTETTIPTGWENVDHELEGGVTIPSLNYLLAKSGGGKSIGLVNLSWNYIQQGKDVVYISLELKEAKIMKRYITHSAKIPTHEIPNKEMEIYNHLKKCDEKGYGRFTVQFYQPNSLSAIKLELFVRNYIQKYGTTPVLIVDYAGLMIPNGKGWQGMFERDKYVSEELRGVATLFDTIVWTADQYNRCIAFGEKVETPEGQKNIEDVIVGDLVLGTNNEWRTVTAVSPVEEQEVYEITTKSGKTIQVSARHIFPKEIDDRIIEDSISCSLQIGDMIYVKE
jgi:replicative DNA helicase